MEVFSEPLRDIRQIIQEQTQTKESYHVRTKAERRRDRRRVHDKQKPYPEVMQKIKQVLNQRLHKLALSLKHGCFLYAVVKILRKSPAEHEAYQKPRHLQKGIRDRKLKAHFAAPFSESSSEVHLTVMQ